MGKLQKRNPQRRGRTSFSGAKQSEPRYLNGHSKASQRCAEAQEAHEMVMRLTRVGIPYLFATLYAANERLRK